MHYYLWKRFEIEITSLVPLRQTLSWKSNAKSLNSQTLEIIIL